jgi:uracil DNA glycosylase superfamily protein
MSHPFCPGYVQAPFDSLAADYPGEDVYPAEDFRVEWGPIFHRGRLDGTARVLILGQDPATHESITRRILVGEAGQRVQGLLARIGITTSYVMVNAFLYSVFGQAGGTRHATDPVIAQHRNRWLDALLLPGGVQAVVTLGGLARTAYTMWADGQPAAAARLHVATIRHPTYPESASRSGVKTLAEASAELLANWNEALPGLHAHVEQEQPTPLRPYADRWQPDDLAPIPSADLPAGSPPWWRSLSAWARRTGEDAQSKRATISVTVPPRERPWPPLDPVGLADDLQGDDQ